MGDRQLYLDKYCIAAIFQDLANLLAEQQPKQPYAFIMEAMEEIQLFHESGQPYVSTLLRQWMIHRPKSAEFQTEAKRPTSALSSEKAHNAVVLQASRRVYGEAPDFGSPPVLRDFVATPMTAEGSRRGRPSSRQSMPSPRQSMPSSRQSHRGSRPSSSQGARPLSSTRNRQRRVASGRQHATMSAGAQRKEALAKEMRAKEVEMMALVHASQDDNLFETEIPLMIDDVPGDELGISLDSNTSRLTSSRHLSGRGFGLGETALARHADERGKGIYTPTPTGRHDDDLPRTRDRGRNLSRQQARNVSSRGSSRMSGDRPSGHREEAIASSSRPSSARGSQSALPQLVS